MTHLERWMVTAALVAGAPAVLAQDQLGRNLAATCANCHGTNGASRGDVAPLAGRAAPELIAAMTDFKSGARSATIMQQIAKGYSDEQLRLIAAFFAAQARP
jgi:cytochrome c553